MSELSRKERRSMQQDGILKKGELNTEKFRVRKDIKTKTENQIEARELWDEGCHLALTGYPGTGKTFLALWFALGEVLSGKQEKIAYFRSTAQARNQGFLPGGLKEKGEPFECPAIAKVNDILDRPDAYGILNRLHMFEFQTTSFLRGLEFNDTIMIVDECQNMTFHELDTIMGRVGKNTRFILCGDLKQSDIENHQKREESGMRTMLRVLDRTPDFEEIEFGVDDIVRSGFVKDYIIAKEEIGL